MEPRIKEREEKEKKDAWLASFEKVAAASNSKPDTIQADLAARSLKPTEATKPLPAATPPASHPKAKPLQVDHSVPAAAANPLAEATPATLSSNVDDKLPSPVIAAGALDALKMF